MDPPLLGVLIGLFTYVTVTQNGLVDYLGVITTESDPVNGVMLLLASRSVLVWVLKK